MNGVTEAEEARFRTLGDWTDFTAYRGALVIPEDREGRALLQLRDLHAPVHPGEWGLFGGGVEEGETLAEAAAREFEEETGLALPQSAFTPFARVVSPPSRRRLYAFTLAFPAGPEAIRLGEGAGFAFLPPSEFAALNLVEATRILLDAWRETLT